jgi:hypothetical protein
MEAMHGLQILHQKSEVKAGGIPVVFGLLALKNQDEAVAVREDRDR